MSMCLAAARRARAPRTGQRAFVYSAWLCAAAAAISACNSPRKDFPSHDRDAATDGAVGVARAALAIDNASVAPIAAYSVALKLRAAYAGSAFRLRRASDNALLDVGFIASNRVNASALSSFCGASDCLLATVYDQSGNARDLSQATAGNQIKIYDGASKALVGGGSSPVLSAITPGKTVERPDTLGLSGNPAFTIAYQGRYLGAGTGADVGPIRLFGSGTTRGNQLALCFNSPGSDVSAYFGDGDMGWAVSGNTLTHRGVFTHAAGANIDAMSFRFNGTPLALARDNQGAIGLNLVAPGSFMLGKHGTNGSGATAEVSSVLVWNTVLGANDLALVEQLLDPSNTVAPSSLCYGAPGAQALSPWPMVGLCPMHRGQSPAKAAQTNALRWTPAQIGTGSIRGSVAIAADGTVFAPSSGRLAAVVPATGVQSLTASARSPGSSVAIGSDGTVYSIASTNSLEGRHPSAWTTLKINFALGSTASTGPVIGPDGTIYVTSSNGKLRAITPAGVEKWPALTFAAISSSPAIGADGVIYVAADDGLHAVNPNGTVRWNFSLGTGVFARSTPAIGADGTLYVGTDSNKLVAVTPGASSATVRWNFAVGGAVRSAPAVAADGTVYFGSRDHKVYAVKPDGTAKWATPRTTGSNVDSSPAIGADGTVYIGSDDSRLYALRPADGTVLFSYLEGNAIRSAVAIGRDGTVYAGADDAKLVAIGPGTCTATDTTCDGNDDNCNGTLDEGYVSTASSCGVGACARGAATTCIDGTVRGGTCTPGTPSASDTTCNAFDENCNGQNDEGFAGTPTSCGVGACARIGTTPCVNGSVQNSCVPGTPAASDTTCDGIDDNCNGVADEGFTSSSTSCGVGACASTGTTSCVNGTLQNSCVASNPLTSFDADCDGVDDDCNGTIDDACGVNLAINGSFETGIDPNIGKRPPLPGEAGNSDQPVIEPQYMIWERSDTDGTAGALRVNMTATDGFNFHNTGFFLALKTAVPTGSWLRVTLRAKSLSGAYKLNMLKSWGGSTPAQVNLTNEWATYEMVVLTGQPTSGLVFNVVRPSQQNFNIQPVATGSFLLDDIDVRFVGPCTSSTGCGNTNPEDIFGSKLAEVWDGRVNYDRDEATTKFRSLKGTKSGSLLVTTPPPNDAYYDKASVLDDQMGIYTWARGYATGSLDPTLLPSGAHPYIAIVHHTWFTYTDGSQTPPRMFELRARNDGSGPMLALSLGPNSAGNGGTTATYTPDASSSGAFNVVAADQNLFNALTEVWLANDGLHYAKNGVESPVTPVAAPALSEALRYAFLGNGLGGNAGIDASFAEIVLANDTPSPAQRAAYQAFVRKTWSVPIGGCSGIDRCSHDDSCCPQGCTSDNDEDCGTGPFASNCHTVTSCVSGDDCCPANCTPTTDGNCAYCSTVTRCLGGDGCCPANCSPTTDGDCAPIAPTCDINAACSAACQCTSGRVCASDSDCAAGLSCAFGIGARFGQPANVGVCWDPTACATLHPDPANCGSTSAYCGTCCVPNCSAPGEADGCGGTCQACVAGVDTDGDGLLDCTEDADGDPWTDRYIFNGVTAYRSPSCHAMPTCEAMDSVDEIIACAATTPAVHDLASGWNFATTDSNVCQSGFGFAPAWPTCGQDFALHNTGVMHLQSGTHCFQVTGSMTSQCAALAVDDQPLTLTGGAAVCVQRPTGVYPISWFYETTNHTQNELHLSYCFSASGPCTPVQPLPSQLLRRAADRSERLCDADSPCSAECPCGSGRACDAQGAVCADSLECRSGFGDRFGYSASTPVCWSPACDDPTSTLFACGSPGALCGACPECTVNCTGKSCGSDGCWGTCGTSCNAGQAGCQTDGDCADGLVCGRNNGTRFGLAEALRVCWPASCEDLDTSNLNCGSTSSPCGTCPVCQPDCAGRHCGDNGCGGSCGSCTNAQCDTDAGVCVGAAPILQLRGDLQVDTAAVGTIPASFAVSDTGAATYTMPIAVPPGRGGIQPALALRYDSSRGTGYLGIGWSLEGFSSITRCDETVSQDGRARAPRFRYDDTFCLDGQHLRPESGAANYPAGTAEFFYRTEDDQFARIKADFDIVPDVHPETYTFRGPTRFTVWAKDGRIFEYEPINDLVRQPDEFTTLPVEHVRIWVLTTVRDHTADNSMHIAYRNRAAELSDGHASEFYPYSISYGPAGSPILVALKYTFDDEFNEERARPINGWHLGANVQVGALLRRIEIQADGETVRHYDIGYDTTEPRVAERDHLTSVAECAAQVCKPATQFSYGPFPDVAPTTLHEPVPVLAGTSGIKLEPVEQAPSIGPRVLDINGDGLDDLLFASYSDSGACFMGYRDRVFWNIYLSTRSADRAHNTDVIGHGVKSSTLLAGEYKHCPFSSDRTLASNGTGAVIDWNNDGRQEFLEFDWREFPDFAVVSWDPATETLQRTHTGIPRPGHAYLLDINGDGYKDLLACDNRTQWRLYINDGGRSGKGTPAFDENLRRPLAIDAPCTDSSLPVDPEGDGSEALFLAGSQQKITFDADEWSPTVTPSDMAIPDAQATLLACLGPHPDQQALGACSFLRAVVPQLSVTLDMNGDGLTDVVTLDTLVNRALQIHLSRGDGSFALQVQRLGRAGPHSIVAWDADQDGRDDLLLRDSQGWSVLRSLGRKFDRVTDAVQIPASAFPVLPIDSDGDGVPGLVFDELDWKVAERASNARDKLRTVRDGLGARTTITYAPLTNPLVYTSGLFNSDGTSDCTYPFLCVQPRHEVVRYQFESDTADTGQVDLPIDRAFGHAYADARFDALGRGGLGFARHTMYQQDPRDATTKRTVEVSFDNRTEFLLDADYPDRRAYPWALRPNRVVTTTLVDDTYFISDQLRDYGAPMLTVPFAYAMLPRTVAEQTRSIRSNGQADIRGMSTWEALEYDDRGNALRERFTTAVGETILVEQTYKHQSDTSFDDEWLISLPTQRVVTATTPAPSEQRRRETTFDYYPSGLLEEIKIDPNSDNALTTHYNRNPYNGNIMAISQLSAQGLRATSITYDSLDEYPVETTNPVGHHTSFGFDHRTGLLRYVEDENRLRSEFGYDGFGRLGIEVTPDLVATTTTYGAVSSDLPLAVETQVDGGDRKRAELDVHGRVINEHVWGTNGKPLVRTSSYDLDGNLSYQTRFTDIAEPPSSGVTYGHDNLGRLRLTRLPNGDTSTACYDIRTSCATDPRGYTRCKALDPQGRVALSADPVLGPCQDVLASTVTRAGVSYGYGPFSDLTTITDREQHSIVQVADDWGRTVLQIDPDAGQRSFAYTPFGELWYSDDANGRHTEFLYDGLGRLNQRSDTLGGQTQITQWIWDGGPGERAQDELIGSLTETHSPDGARETYVYDPATGRLSGTRFALGSGPEFSTGYHWDAFGRLEQIDYPRAAGTPALSVAYDYDAYGHVTTVCEPTSNGICDPPNVRMPYWRVSETDKNDLLKTESFRNLALTTRGYDINGRPETITTTGVGSLPSVQAAVYGYDPSGNVHTITDSIRGVTTTFGYDEFDRLQSDDSAAGVIFSYDHIGNVSWNTNVVYSDPRPHALSSDGTYTFCYDLVGNRVRKLAQDASERTTYTPFDKPAAIWTEPANLMSPCPTTSDAQGAQSNLVSFAYDADQTRVRKLTADSSTLYVDGLYEQRTTTAAPTEHVFAVSNGMRVFAQITLPDGGGPAKFAYLHDDLIGTTRVVSDGNGQTQEFDYDTFGARRNPFWPDPTIPANTTGVNRGFAGQEADDHGLINMGGRIYDPSSRQFTSPDPLLPNALSSGGLNRYAYALNNPLKYVDPSGYDAVPSVGGGGSGGGGGATGSWDEEEPLPTFGAKARVTRTQPPGEPAPQQPQPAYGGSYSTDTGREAMETTLGSIGSYGGPTVAEISATANARLSASVDAGNAASQAAATVAAPSADRAMLPAPFGLFPKDWSVPPVGPPIKLGIRVSDTDKQILLQMLSLFIAATTHEKLEIDPPPAARGAAPAANRLAHIFGKAEHALDDFVKASGGQEQAFAAVQKAANEALTAGKLPVGPNGIIPTGNAGPILDVAGTQIRLIGGRVIDGVVQLSSFSRKGLP